MIELKGKYAECKIFTDVVDQSAIAQITELLCQPMTEGQRIRVMPDVHAGAGCTIGTTMTITDKVVPNLVGVDIGCGMETVRLREKHIELQKLDKLIYEISFFFYMKVPDDFEPECNSSTEDDSDEFLRWITPDEPVKYFPEFFRHELKNPTDSVKHFVTDGRK